MAISRIISFEDIYVHLIVKFVILFGTNNLVESVCLRDATKFHSPVLPSWLLRINFEDS